MTNVEGAAGEGAKLARAYTDAMKKQALVFKIPVFNNMPETACAKPTVNGSPNNKLSGITIDGYSLTPTFSKDTEKYDLVVDSSVSSVNIRATAIDSKATVSGAGTISLGSGTTIVKIVVKAENGDTRTYQVSIAKETETAVQLLSPRQRAARREVSPDQRWDLAVRQVHRAPEALPAVVPELPIREAALPGHRVPIRKVLPAPESS